MRRVIIIISGLALVVVLVAAAYVGGRLVQGQGLEPGQQGKPPVGYAAEMPPRNPDLYAALVRRADNILVVCNPANGKLTTNADGTVSSQNGCDGPEIQVVIGHDTRIYHDVTALQNSTPPAAGEKLQQKVEPGTLDDISAESRMLVWGESQGERMVAEVLVYWIPGGGRSQPAGR